MNVASRSEAMLAKNVVRRDERVRRSTGSEWLDDDLEALDAELAAILVDLEARAKYSKVEGAALPLLAHAKEVSEALQARLTSVEPRRRAWLASEAARLDGQLHTIERAFGELRSSPSMPGNGDGKAPR
jgi:hypothetical protein